MLLTSASRRTVGCCRCSCSWRLSRPARGLRCYHGCADAAEPRRPTGGMLASCGADDSTVKLWAVRAGSEQGKLLRTLAGHTTGVRTVSFSPCGLLLCSACVDSTLHVWHAASGLQLQ